MAGGLAAPWELMVQAAWAAGWAAWLTFVREATRTGTACLMVGAAGLGVVEVSTREADLEDVFLELTSGKSAAA